jgi:arylsulfatase A-like enzyme
MKADAWEAGHRMPLIVRWPQKVARGSHSDQTICFTDLLATLAAITETDLPRDAGPDSFNLLPELLGEHPAEQPIRGPLVMASGNGTMTVRQGPWKYIAALGSGGFSKPKRVQPGPDDPPGQLYNLRDDLGETKNLYRARPEIVTNMQRILAEIQSSPRSRN